MSHPDDFYGLVDWRQKFMVPAEASVRQLPDPFEVPYIIRVMTNSFAKKSTASESLADTAQPITKEERARIVMKPRRPRTRPFPANVTPAMRRFFTAPEMLIGTESLRTTAVRAPTPPLPTVESSDEGQESDGEYWKKTDKES